MTRSMNAQLALRMPIDLHARIKATAAMNFRTMNAEVVFALTRAYAGSEAATGEQAGNHAPAAVTETQSVGPDRILINGLEGAHR